jgi:hypothetical protein
VRIDYAALDLTPKLWRRFWAKVQKTDTCWLWTAAKNPDGYGRFGVGQTLIYPHRLIAAVTYGPIPTDMVVDHLCRVPSCVRPDHLEVVTMRENTTRGTSPTWRAHITGICKRGHSLATHGYYRLGTRQIAACRECSREKKRQARVTSAIVDGAA